MGPYAALIVTCLLVVICVRFGTAQDAADPRTQTKTVGSRLKEDLFRGYDSSERPVRDRKTATTVKVLLWLKHLAFYEEHNSLEIHSWMVWEWNDEFLTWNPSQYDGLDKIRVERWKIWTPDIHQFSSSDMGTILDGDWTSLCLVEPQGKVVCVPPSVHQALCVPDLTMWPFDRQTCDLELGSWLHSGDLVNPELMNEGHALVDYQENRDWELVRMNSSRNVNVYENLTYPSLKFEFVIQRHAGGHASTVVVPAMVLAALTLVTFWLDPCSPNRLSIVCLTLLAECLYLQYLGMAISSNGDTCPVIVLFYRDALVLGAFALVQTMLVRAMKGKIGTPPLWMMTPVTFVLGSRPGQFLLLSESPLIQDEDAKQDSAAPDSSPPAEAPPASKDSWRTVALLLDRIFFAIFLLCFLILSIRYVP